MNEETPAGDHLFLLLNAAVVFYLCVCVCLSHSHVFFYIFFYLPCSNIMKESLYQIVCACAAVFCTWFYFFFISSGGVAERSTLIIIRQLIGRIALTLFE